MKKQKQFNKSLKPSSKNWIKRHINDPYVALAKQNAYRTRSAFKLIEIQEKFKIIKDKDIVLDLGAAPGGWSQIASKITQNVIAVDILEVAPIPNVQFIQGDFLNQSTLNLIKDAIGESEINVILSDMCPNTCGIKKIDHLRIINIFEEVTYFAKNHLKTGGSLVVKVFQGGAEKNTLTDIKMHFRKISHFKPKSSRKQSPELYLIATGFIGNGESPFLRSTSVSPNDGEQA
ncbi:MAG: RlmE family RNA methyltransferase [Holosporales bacterium]|jgi:23S rRNA (uridine2552-2'-O)-methyltransferase|nr:RlmE family RNA methyltransferase [Holosporales bacterium]